MIFSKDVLKIDPAAETETTCSITAANYPADSFTGMEASSGSAAVLTPPQFWRFLSAHSVQRKFWR